MVITGNQDVASQVTIAVLRMRLNRAVSPENPYGLGCLNGTRCWLPF